MSPRVEELRCRNERGRTGEQMRYGEAFKQRMVEKVLRPGGPGTAHVAREARVREETLSRWVAEARRLSDMSKQKKADVAGRTRTPEEKLRLVLEASSLEGQALGEFLRREGLLEAEVVQWRKDATAGLARSSGKPSAEARELAAVKKELLRKERALAEAAALLVLQKKVREIWGDEDESTPARSDR